MKKTPHNPDDLYAKVNKPNRTPLPPQPEEVVYADLNIGGGRGQQPHNPSDTLYAAVNKGGRGQQPHNPSDTVYATVNTGSSTVNNERGQEQQSQSLRGAIYTDKDTGEKKRAPATMKNELISNMLKNDDFQARVERIQALCTVVYGNEHALNTQLSEILDNPKKGEEISWELAANPEKPGKLMGATVFGMKSQDRKQAEEGFVLLCETLDKHATATQKLQNELTHALIKERAEERGEQRRHHHHHERDQHSPKQEAQQHRHREEKKAAALAM